MKISASRVAMEAQSASWQRQEASLRLTRRTEGAGASRDESAAARLPEAGRKMQADAAIPTEPVQDGRGDLSPSLQVLKSLLEWALGRSIELVEVRQLETPEADVPVDARVPEDPASGPAGSGLGGTLTVRTLTVEQLAFSASGRVQTADGRSIEFSLGLALTRATASEVQAAFGSEVQDPLVLDFAGTGAELRDIGFRFDLRGDGSEVDLPLPTSGKGFLVFDRDGNGRVDDGRELFGPSTGDGFGELAALDADGNGWIDENDPAWSQLYVWHPYRRDALTSGCCAAPESIFGSRAALAPSLTST
ncbi:MAG: hypothetical protein HZA65_09720 [Rhodocyclales bacterium]|nr:hypothetical protein [Rhodocyclales bacterium]